MSATPDKRRRSDLDLFVLALIESGVSTPYELKSAAEISPGASIPALRRLLSERLVVQGKPGSRGRTDYQITAQGHRRLKDRWRELVDQGPSGDLDADPDSVPPLAHWYRRLRSASAVALTKGESAAALAMAKALPRGASGRTGRARTRGDRTVGR